MASKRTCKRKLDVLAQRVCREDDESPGKVELPDVKSFLSNVSDAKEEVDFMRKGCDAINQLEAFDMAKTMRQLEETVSDTTVRTNELLPLNLQSSRDTPNTIEVIIPADAKREEAILNVHNSRYSEILKFESEKDDFSGSGSDNHKDESFQGTDLQSTEMEKG